MRKKLLAYAIKYGGEYHRMKKAIENEEEVKEVEFYGNYITILDENYPKQLLNLKHPPFVLFYEGNLSLLSKHSVAVIGSRKCSAYGMKMTKVVVDHLKSRCVIVSGMAKGIDAIAHKAALQNSTIALIGCGLNVCYPKENRHLFELLKKHHLVISEYPPNTLPLAHHFPWRNRLIAALSDAVVVIEAKKKSGTMFTVNEALDLNKTIYCLPYHYEEEEGAGNNLLIQQGAQILMEESDFDEI